MAKLWLGNRDHQQWVPCPRTGMARTKQGYSEEIEFANGGIWVENSAAWHNTFSMEFPVQPVSEYEGIEAFNRFASGEYGDDYLYFVDTMHSDLNLAPVAIANPNLMVGTKGAWKNMLSYADPVSVDWTPAPGLGLPEKAARFPITWQPDVPATGRTVKFLVPPGYALWIAATGTSSGTGSLSYSGKDWSGGIAPLNTTPEFTLAVAGGGTGEFVEFFLSRSNYTDSTVTLNSISVRILPMGETPTFDRFRPGAGHFGLKFRGNTLPEEYVMADRHLVGMSAELVEVEPWGLRG